MRRLALLLAIAAAIAVFFSLDLDRYLTLAYARDSVAQFQQLRESEPLTLVLGYFVVYVTVTALSLPGAAIMTLAGGALFGLGQGTLIVSFASSIGALLAFLVARYLLRATVQDRFGDRLRAINDGVRRDGALYLFTLRLVPVFPFFIINLLMALTPIRAGTYYLVSQVGMLPATVVYVNAGTQLGQLDSASGILSPGLIASFALLGVFPLLARKLSEALKRRRVYRRWQKPKRFDRNLVVIGAGAAGLVSAYIAATVRSRVTLVEAGAMGGDCLNTGCVPSKALLASARLAARLRDAERYGIRPAAAPTVDFPAVVRRVQSVIRAIEPHDSVERYEGLGVEVARGYARIEDPWTVAIRDAEGGEQRLTTRAIVIAAGAAPVVPPLPGLDAVECLTSETLWDAMAGRDAPPARIVVLGGGPIGCELAQAFARLGSAVTVIEMLPRLLGREDTEAAEAIARALTEDGITLQTGHRALRCEPGADGASDALITECDGVEHRHDFDTLLCAIGRRPRLEGYGLEALGIDTRGPLVANDYLETLYPNILAAGDAAGPYQFTHVASHQAWYAAVNALFGQFKRFAVDYRVIPRVTYTDPEVASVGLTEAEAAERGIAVTVTRYGLDDLDRAIAEGHARGFVKILTAPGKDRILGATLVGDHAGELLAEIVLAMKHKLGLNKLLGTIHAYPTWAEANKFAAGQWKKAHAPERVLALLERYHRWRRG
ncbi:FAD-dependent oxidoreductase [Pseudohaliea rubra]|uniref:Putative membrane protein family, FAD-dependent NAD(P)-disulfide oxidoreductase n=1 Tax=Pseudohaliea rubra DSM 19751 TaxID=1265313 RepID=A0A095VS68_9GAMM|nr:bifunctional TVP38/TMEM64 family protein/FAD-dependent oxidoreductase [Pseudohaliea rubra]KGE04210.1 putative membrane protein family, FAD-dependent NAD(P)-disulfide oxidoreductase [Pseudohaliea rubra DSM 19751]